MEIGEQYLSNISNSSGRTYEIIGFTPGLNGVIVVNLKDVNSEMRANYNTVQIEEWITEGRLKLVGKNLMV